MSTTKMIIDIVSRGDQQEVFLNRVHIGTLFSQDGLWQGFWYGSREQAVAGMIPRKHAPSPPVTVEEVRTALGVWVGGVLRSIKTIDDPRFGRTTIYFGGPGRACDHGLTWIYLEEVLRTAKEIWSSWRRDHAGACCRPGIKLSSRRH